MNNKKLKELAEKAAQGGADSMLISPEGARARTRQEKGRAVSDRAMEALVLAREVFTKDPNLDPKEVIKLACAFVDVGKEFFAKELEPFVKEESRIEPIN